MRYCFYLSLFLLSFFSNSYGAERIKVVTFEYPPIYQNKDDVGLSCEIVNEAFKAVNIGVDLSFLPVKRMILSVSSGDAVCGIGGKILFQDPKVSNSVTPSEIVQYVVQTFIYDSRRYPGGIKYNDLDEMKDYRIGVLDGSGIMRFLEKNGGLRLYTNTIHAGSAKQLYHERIDVWAIVDLTGFMYLKEIYPDEYRYFKCTKPYNLGDVSLIFSKLKDPYNNYKNKFQDGLAIIKKNGTYMKIMAKYYGGESLINRDSLPDDLK